MNGWDCTDMRESLCFLSLAICADFYLLCQIHGSPVAAVSEFFPLWVIFALVLGF